MLYLSFWAAAPEGQMTYDSTQGDFLRFPGYVPPSPGPQQVAQEQYVVSDTHCPALYVGDCR